MKTVLIVVIMIFILSGCSSNPVAPTVQDPPPTTEPEVRTLTLSVENKPHYNYLLLYADSTMIDYTKAVYDSNTTTTTAFTYKGTAKHLRVVNYYLNTSQLIYYYEYETIFELTL